MRTLKYLLALTMIFILSQPLFAQMADTVWTKRFGGNRWDEGSSVRRLDDGGYIITGYSASFGDALGDFYVVRTDYHGNTIWENTYGGNDWDWAYCLATAPAGGFVTVGYSQSFGEGIGTIYFIKINGGGQIEWTKTYGSQFNDDARCVQRTKQHGIGNGYIICGWTHHPEYMRDVYLIRTDYDGDTLWTKRYGEDNDELGYWVSQTPDYGYVVTGAVRYNDNLCTDMYLLKTDPYGNTLWSRNYGGENYECAYQVIQDYHSGGYVLIGESKSFGTGDYDIYMVKTDAEGDTVWTRTYGGPGDEHGYKVLYEPDGYVIVGSTESYGAGDFDIWLIKTDVDGNAIGARTYGGRGFDYGFSVIKTDNNEYLITGTTGSFSSNGTFDAYLLKVHPDFTVGIDDDNMTIPDDIGLSQNYPNPFNAKTSIRFELTKQSQITLDIYDVLGNKITTLANDIYPAGNHNISFDAFRYASGIYFYKLDTGDYTETKKMLLIK